MKTDVLRASLIEDMAQDSPIRVQPPQEPSWCILHCGSGKPCDTSRCPLPDPNDPEHQ